MLNAKAVLIAVSSLATISAFAEESAKKFHPWEILLFGGTSALDADNTLIHISEDETDKITQSNAGDWKSWSLQLGLGYIIPLSDAKHRTKKFQWFPSIEPQMNLYFLKGNIEGAVDRFYQYAGNYSDTDYKINLESTRLMFDIALTFASYRNFSIFGIAGIGPSWNRIGYDTGVVNEAELHLSKKTQTNFAYEFGGGISYAFTEHLSVTGEYLFTGFNNIELSENGIEGNDREITVKSDKFDLNAQTVFFGLRYAF
jgi:opacity protein-like surface antigen